jgi:hypothetical protein
MEEQRVAQQRSVSLIDDIDGTKAVETLTFGLDGSRFEIDLSKKNAAALRKALTEFVEHGRRVKPTTSATRQTVKRNAGPTPAVVREWASGQGIAVSARGRVRADVISQYEAANA